MTFARWTPISLLPKTQRLRKKKDFEEVIKKGRSVVAEFLVLKFLKNDLGTTRIGFVVSRKISNKATVRNKVKRRLREAVRPNFVHLKPGYDLVFFARKTIDKKIFWEIKEKVEWLLEKARLFQ